MVSTSNFGSVKTRYYQAGGKLLLSLAITLLMLAMLPFTSQAATFELGGNLGLSLSDNPTITETDIRAGKNTSNNQLSIILTLNDNTWADDVESPAKLHTLIDGLSAPLNDDAVQWEKVKTALKEKAQSSSRTNFFKYNISTRSVEIILPKVADYDIADNQIISVGIAPSLLNDAANPVSITKDFKIKADCQATLTSNIRYATDIVNGGSIISLSLTNSEWEANVINLTSKRNAFFDSFSTNDEKAEWNKVIKILKAYPDPAQVLAISGDKRTITITLPPVPDYQIANEQTIKITYKNNWYNNGLITDNLAASQPALSFAIAPAFSTAALGGTIINTPVAGNIVAGGQTIEIKLSGNNEWQGNIASNQAMINTLVDGFSAVSEADSWNRLKSELKKSAITTNLVTLNDAKTLIITLPSIAKYDISADQTINVNINPTLLKYNHAVNLTPNSFLIKADGAATVTGTVAPLLTEADMIGGGKTIIITLTNHKWIPDVVSKADNRNLLMDGFKVVKDISEEEQWKNAVQVIKASASFTRISDIVVSITLPRSDGFNIDREMEVNLTVPASLVATSSADLAPVYAFKVLPVSDQIAKLSGTAVAGVTEGDIIAGGKTITITLSNDIWVADIVSNDDKRNALLNGFLVGNNSWAAVINNPATKIARESDTVVTITLPPYAGFTITDDLIITLKIPKSVLTTASTEITAAPFTISAITAVLSGTAISAPLNVKDIIAGGKTIVITLKNAAWIPDLVNQYEQLLNRFGTNDTAEWNKIKEKITTANVSRNSNNVVTIKLPPVPGYTGDNFAVHWIKVNIPAALLIEKKDISATPNLQVGSSASARLSVGGNKLDKLDVILGGRTITITLEECTWVADVVSNASKLKSLLKGLTADSDTANWNLVMNALQAKLENVERVSDTRIVIELPPVPNYDPINEQRISLTIPKNLLLATNDNVMSSNDIVISMPSGYYQGTLQYLLDYNILNHYINTKPLQDIYLEVPVKYVNSVVVGQTKLNNSVITSMDVYTDSAVNKVSVIVNGNIYSSKISVNDGKGKKFNIGFAYNQYSSGGKDADAELDAIINVSGRNLRLQDDVTIKINGAKTYNIAPKTDLQGSYSLYKLVNNSKLFTSILDYYIPADIRVHSLTP